ncbi:MAG: acyl-CoA thioesterase [Pseudomonadota bacterium]
MQGKNVSQSSIVMTHCMMPHDANPAGNVHGGVVMKYIDDAAAMAAIRHVRGLAVTASIDTLSLHRPVFVGELVFFRASVNLTGRSSMEVGVRVDAENIFTGELRHVASAYLTFVAVDDKGKPRQVPPLIAETGDEKRRVLEAGKRREKRLSDKT